MKIRSVTALVSAGALVAVSLVSLVSASSAAALTKVTFAYDFPGPDFALIPAVVAQKEGFFAAAGLNVSVVFPPNTSTTTQMLTTSAAQVGFVTTTDMGVAINAGAPVVSIGNYSMKNNWALFAKPGVSLTAQHITSELKGKTIFSYGDTWTEAMLPFVLRYAKLTSSQVKVLTAPSGNDLTDLIAGKVNISTSTTNYEIPGFIGSGIKGSEPTLLGTSVGAPNIPIWVYATTHAYSAQHAKTLKAFMSAIAKATKWAVAHPTAAATLFDRTYPKSGYTNAYNLKGWQLTVPFLTNSSDRYFTQTTQQWATLSSALKSIGLITKVHTPSTYFTNAYLPAS